MTVTQDSTHVYTCDTQEEYDQLCSTLDPPPAGYTIEEDGENLTVTATRTVTL